MATTNETDGSTKDTYSSFPWVCQTFLLAHYCCQDCVLAEIMTCLKDCKQRSVETIADFEERCKYRGRRYGYCKMKAVEDELIRDRFIIGIRDDKPCADLLRHKKKEGAVVPQEEVITKAKVSETSTPLNAHVIERQRTTEQLNPTSTKVKKDRARTGTASADTWQFRSLLLWWSRATIEICLSGK